MSKQLDYIAIGNRIRKVREKRFLTQEQLAEGCSLSTSHIGHIERGTRIPSLETLFNISEFLDVSLDYLVFDSTNTDNAVLNSISSILKTKNKNKVNIYLSTIKALADKIDEL